MSHDSLTIQRTFQATPDRVFAAFASKEGIEAWFGPEGCNTPSVQVDARPGGKYRIEMHCTQSGVHIVTGEYREVRPPEKLVFTWAWLEGAKTGPETLISLTFSPHGNGTQLTIVHSGFASMEARNGHEEGWTSSMACLEHALRGERQSNAPRALVLGDPRSTYVRSARMALVEKGISYTIEPHAPHSDAIRATHLFGKVPAFRFGELTLFETSAIMRYVDEAFPGPPLLPESAADRARAEQWISAISAYLYGPMIRGFVLQFIFPKGPDGKPDRVAIDAATVDINQHLRILDAAYGTRDYLVADRPSLADLLLAPILFYMGNIPAGAALLEPFANVRRAQAAIARRESFKQTLPPSG